MRKKGSFHLMYVSNMLSSRKGNYARNERASQEAASQLSNRVDRKFLEYSGLEVRICLQGLESNAGVYK